MNESQSDTEKIKLGSKDTSIHSPKHPEKDRPNKKERSGRHGARNQHRHKKIVKWIVQKFPKEIELATENDIDIDGSSNNNDNYHNSTINEASKDTTSLLEKPAKPKIHILDVAGGKGELSARMTICHRLNVKMVDPRPANISECFHKLIYRSLPKKWQQKISQNPNVIENALERRFEQHVMYFPADADGQMCIEALESNKVLLETVIGCSLMIGMHSDGATEAIVDIAMKFRKPFMVVPCCVFPNFFKHRFIPRWVVEKHDNDDGDEGNSDSNVNVVEKSKVVEEEGEDLIPVRSHEQFCKYLLRKDSHFTEEILPFEGRNIAICWDGQELDSDDIAL